MASAVVLEHCDIHPSSAAAAAELTLPLVHFDMLWLSYHPSSALLFFDLTSCSNSQFTHTILPKLKQSLAQALDHFLPLAGKIAIPLSHDGRPFVRFSPGDSLSLTVSEYNKDFDYLIKNNHPRFCHEFHACIPRLPPPAKTTFSDDDEVVLLLPPLAVQITLFPDRGLCLGFIVHHAVGDFSSIVRFIRTWAVLNNDINVLEQKKKKTTALLLLPYYDRSSVADPEGLDKIYWNVMKRRGKFVEKHQQQPVTTNKMRQTFVLTAENIRKLKASALKSKPNIRATAFTVVGAFVWASLIKAEEGDETAAVPDDDEAEYFGFMADIRERLTPPLPAAYFGNCLASVVVVSTHGELRSDAGFAAAAECIWAGIRKTVYNEKGILDGAETWPVDHGMLVGKRFFGVSGSPRFDLYDVDYGFGTPKKFEIGSIDKTMSLCRSTDFEGGLEFCLSRPRETLEKFSAVFAKGLKDLS